MLTAEMIDLVSRIQEMPPYWHAKAVKALEGVVLDHADWQLEGCPNPEVWEVYRLVRHFGSIIDDETVEGWRATLKAAGVAPPKPLHLGEGLRGQGE